MTPAPSCSSSVPRPHPQDSEEVELYLPGKSHDTIFALFYWSEQGNLASVKGPRPHSWVRGTWDNADSLLQDCHAVLYHFFLHLISSSVPLQFLFASSCLTHNIWFGGSSRHCEIVSLLQPHGKCRFTMKGAPAVNPKDLKRNTTVPNHHG